MVAVPVPCIRYCRFLADWLEFRMRWIFLLSLLWLCLHAGEDSKGSPNFLLILTDDQGFGDVSIHGNEWISTPNIDRIAQEGARFERFFVEPVCAPTRAAILSGRYPTRTGVHGVTRNQEIMRGEETTIAELLRDKAGYSTGCFGKWHNGSHWPNHPNAQGFDTFFGFCGGHWNDYFDPVLERNGEESKTRGFIADVLTREAIGFLRENVEQSKSFFCYVPYNTPHTPASVPDEEWRKWRDAKDPEDDFTRAMYALCENIDSNVGRLLNELEALNVHRETVVLFLTDNGPNGQRFNDGMLGVKGSEMEGGLRVPCFIRWPGKIEPGTVVDRNAAHIDLLPTLCSFAGIGPSGSIDGVDLSPLLLGGEEQEWSERYFYTWRNPKKWSIRSDQYRATEKSLHDLIADPGQKENLAGKFPEKHRELIDAYREWEADAVPSSPMPEPVQIGFSEQPKVTVKAHEFEVRPGEDQGIAYCEERGYANQWITRWSDPEAFADCPLRVVSPGTYRVTFRYATSFESNGAIFRLSAGGESLEFPITEIWNSAVYPAPEQVSKRNGGYLSREEWFDVVVGEMTLEEGDHLLKLEAVEKPGEYMPDFKAVILEKL